MKSSSLKVIITIKGHLNHRMSSPPPTFSYTASTTHFSYWNRFKPSRLISNQLRIAASKPCNKVQTLISLAELYNLFSVNRSFILSALLDVYSRKQQAWMKLLKSSSSYILLKTGNRVHSNAVTKQLSNQTIVV